MTNRRAPPGVKLDGTKRKTTVRPTGVIKNKNKTGMKYRRAPKGLKLDGTERAKNRRAPPGLKLDGTKRKTRKHKTGMTYRKAPPGLKLDGTKRKTRTEHAKRRQGPPGFKLDGTKRAKRKKGFNLNGTKRKFAPASAGSLSVARATMQADLTAELAARGQADVQIVWGKGAKRYSSVPENIMHYDDQQLAAYVEILKAESYKLSRDLIAKHSAGPPLDTKHLYLVACTLDSHVTNGMCPKGAKSVRQICQATKCNFTVKGGGVGLPPSEGRNFASRYSTPARPPVLIVYISRALQLSLAAFIRKLSFAAFTRLSLATAAH
jgi:hypothetical protein